MAASIAYLKTPAFVAPCLAQSRTEPPSGEGSLHELKLDGFRVQVLKDGRLVRLLSRNGLDLGRRFPDVTLALLGLPSRRALLDGELVAHAADGRPDFGALLRAGAGSPNQILFWAFDLLHLDGRDIRELPLEQRKQRLTGVVGGAQVSCLQVCESFPDGAALLTGAERFGFEGVVSKRADAPYRSGRYQRIEVITGPARRRRWSTEQKLRDPERACEVGDARWERAVAGPPQDAHRLDSSVNPRPSRMCVMAAL